jgi:predicted transcriptional regulator
MQVNVSGEYREYSYFEKRRRYRRHQNIRYYKDIRRLPIVDTKGQMVGIITAKDIFKPLIKVFKQVAKDKDLIPDGFDLLGLIGVE